MCTVFVGAGILGAISLHIRHQYLYQRSSPNRDDPDLMGSSLAIVVQLSCACRHPVDRELSLKVLIFDLAARLSVALLSW